ncbi:MAG TPA: peptide ABC transporter substrate-binding protein [Dehalococcoidia bacterium]|nr:peptide ABC transporter substrate-binding protein [Dehalococcoidia bacterium]
MSKRRFWLSLFGVFVLAAGLVAVGCGDDDDDDADTDVTDEATEEEATEEEAADDDDGAAAGDRQEGGEVILHSLEPEEFDPHASSFASDISFERMVWRGLYSLDAENNVVFDANGIAAGEPEISEDGMTFTVTMNEGLTWSDGDDLLAEDFVAGFKRTCNPVNAGDYAYLLTDLTPIAGCADFFNALTDADGNAIDPATVDLQALEDAVAVTAVDDLTIEITLAAPSVTFPIIMSLWPTFPVPVHLPQFANQTPDAPGEWGSDPSSLVYNGPYVWVEYTAQDSIVLEPNPNWSGSTQPVLDRVTLRLIDDAAVANNAFRNEELDFALADSSQLAALEQEFPNEFLLVAIPSTRGVEMQLEDEVLSDLNVRIALSKAIDRETLNEVVTSGGNIPTTSWIPEEISGTPIGTFDEAIGFDPEGAAAALAEAGFEGGAGFPELEILVGDSPSARATAEFLQQQFLEILGINTTIAVVDSATRSTRFTSEEFDLFPGGWIQDYPDPENWIVGLFDTDGGNNHYNCSMPEIDSLVAEAISNTNDEERREQYREIESLIVENVCGIAPYWHESNKYLIRDHLVGFRENAVGQDAVIAGDWFAEGWGLAPE